MLALRRLISAVRLVHPFPSVLDGLVCGAIALVAGGSPGEAARVAAAMVLLQAGIGATNDVVDAPRDAGRKPGKPIPGGLISRRTATVVAVVAFAAGLAVALRSGLVLAALAIVVVTIGLAYDLRLKGTAWSWLPFAIGIPILPVFGWLGVSATVPMAFAVLIPAAVAAGAALAIGNALVDVDRDRSARVASIATELGDARASRIQLVLLLGVWVVAVASTFILSDRPAAALLVGAVGAIAPLAAVVGRPGEPGRRERAWEAEAIGLSLLGVAWSVAVFA